MSQTAQTSYFQKKFKYLGHVLVLGRLAVASQNVYVMKIDVFRIDSTQMRSFSGARNLYRRIIKDFSRNSRPINGFIRKNKKLDWLYSVTEALDAFNMLKSKLAELHAGALLQP